MQPQNRSQPRRVNVRLHWRRDLNCPTCRRERSRVNSTGTAASRSALFEPNVEAATPLPVIIKPFDVLAVRLVSGKVGASGFEPGQQPSLPTLLRSTALLRASVRRHRRAQGGRSTLRSITPTRANSLALDWPIASSAVVGIARGGRVECTAGIGPTKGRHYGPATCSAGRQQTGQISAPAAANRARSRTKDAVVAPSSRI